MKRSLRLWGASLVFVAVALVVSWETIQKAFLGGLKVYESVAPELPRTIPRPAILVFSKTNGFRHAEAIPAANALFQRFAEEHGWGHFQTENGAAFHPEILARFDAVIFNNISGDVFTPGQRAAFRSFVEGGGGFVGIHGSGGDTRYDWDWYVDELIGAQFIGHPLTPRIAQATMHVLDRDHPASSGLPERWIRSEEWYSFEASPRAKGYNILAVVDETTYSPTWLFGWDIAMGDDHPLVWWHCEGTGRTLYSALGHQASAYQEPEYQRLLLGATEWALRLKGDGCGGG